MLLCLSLYFHNELGRFNNLFKSGDRETALISSHSLTQFLPFVDVNLHCGDKYESVHALFQSSLLEQNYYDLHKSVDIGRF